MLSELKKELAIFLPAEIPPRIVLSVNMEVTLLDAPLALHVTLLENRNLLQLHRLRGRI